MRILTIATSRYAEEVKKGIDEQIRKSTFKNIMPRCRVEKSKDVYYLQYTVSDKKLLHLLGLGIQQVIHEYVLMDVMKNIVKNKYDHVFQEQDVKEIYTLINLQAIYNKMNTISLESYINTELINTLAECFEADVEFSLEGFVRFRLRHMSKQMEESIDTLVRQYKAVEEYNQFIDLLKSFIDTQQTKVETIHIVGMDDQSFRILNQYKQDITLQCIQSFKEDFQGIKMNYDDLLIGSLINLVPYYIVFHGYNKTNNRKLLETIYSIFEGRVYFCSNCEICNTLQYVHS